MKANASRILKKIGIAILTAMAFKLLFFRLNDFFQLDVLLIPIIVMIVWEGNICINNQLEQKYKWLENPQKRMFIQFAVSLFFTTISLFIFMNLLHFIKFGELYKQK